MYVESLSGKETPILAIGEEKYSPVLHGVRKLLGCSAKDAQKNVMNWYPLTRLYKLDALEVRNFPEILKSDLLEGKLYARAKRYWEDTNGIKS
jgi:hypothetical protein